MFYQKPPLILCMQHDLVSTFWNILSFFVSLDASKYKCHYNYVIFFFLFHVKTNSNLTVKQNQYLTSDIFKWNLNFQIKQGEGSSREGVSPPSIIDTLLRWRWFNVDILSCL